MQLKVLQHNVGRSHVASSELGQVIREYDADVVLVQEPFLQPDGTPLRYNGLRCLTSEGRPRAAMYVRNSLAVLSLRHLAGRDIVVAQVGYGNTLIYFTSGYLPQNHWEDTLERIEVALDGCGDGLMVLGLDANAYSAAWYSPQLRERDHRGMYRRGDALVQLAQGHALRVDNRPSPLCTFRGHRGLESNIDVTLSSNELYVSDWQVTEETVSDHRLISFRVRRMGAVARLPPSKGYFLLHRANWERLAIQLAAVNVANSGSPEGNAREFMDDLLTVCEGNIPRSTGKHRQVSWWSDELTVARNNLKRAARRLNAVEYSRERNAYTYLVRRKKKESWERLVTSVTKSDPYSVAYRALFKRRDARSGVLVNLRRDDGTLVGSTMRENMEYLVRRLFPEDDANTDDTLHSQVRADSDVAHNSEGGSQYDQPFTQNELASAVQRTRNKRAPGADMITPELFKRLYTAEPELFLRVYNYLFNAGCFPNIWKRGKLVTILKSGTDDTMNAKSYRPITLLSVVGKVYERLICTRLTDLMEERELNSSRQYGFKKERSTVKAIEELVRLSSDTAAPQVVGLFLDIRGALNAWLIASNISV